MEWAETRYDDSQECIDDAYKVSALYLLCVGRDTRIEGVKPIKVIIRRRAGCFKGSSLVASKGSGSGS